MNTLDADKDRDSDDEDPRFYPMAKSYAVFNGQQVEGIPAIALPERTPFQAIAAGEASPVEFELQQARCHAAA